MLKVAKDLDKGFDGLVELSAKVFDGEECSYNEADVDNRDNGVYIIDDDFNIIEREYIDWKEQDDYNPLYMEIFIRLTYELGDTKKKELEKIMPLVYNLMNSMKGE